MCHTPTGRIYIGQRKVPRGKTPATDSYYGSGTAWRNIHKAHPDECVKTVLEVVESKREVDELEKKFIAHYRSVYGELCVNIADGGSGGFTGTCSEATRKKISLAGKGRKHSEDTKRKIAEGNKGKCVSEATRKKISLAHKGKKHSPEVIEKMREVHKKEHLSDETRKKMSLSHRGKQHTEAYKRKMSEFMKGENNPNFGKFGKEHQRYGVKHTPEAIEKMRAAKVGNKNFLGHHHSEETREKIRQSLIKFNKTHEVSQETREKMSKSRTGQKRSEETKKKMSEAAKNRKKKS